MSMEYSALVANIRRFVGDDIADTDDQYRFSPADVNAAMQQAIDQLFQDVPAWLYDTAVIIEPPTVSVTDTTVPVTSAGRIALARLSAYFLLVQDMEDANNVVVAREHYGAYMGERST